MTLFSRYRIDSGATGVGAAPESLVSRGRTMGMVLREARQGFGRDLDQVGSVLRIRPPYLQAIEEGHYDQLPGSTYVIGFIKTYAEYLGLDSAEMVRRFKQETEGLDFKRDLSFPMPLTERSVPGGTILLLALILAICGYGIWYYFSSNQAARPERVGAVPARLLSAVEPTAGTAEPAHPAAAIAAANPPPPPSLPPPSPAAILAAAAPPAASAPTVPVAPAAAITPAAPVSPVALLSTPAVSASLAARPPAAGEVAPLPTDPAHVFGATAGPSRIVLRALSDSWVQVREGDRTQLFQRLMRAGEIYRVPEKPGLTLLIGNAGGIEVLVDGRPAPSLGGIGVVRRKVALDPKRLSAGEAVTE